MLPLPTPLLTIGPAAVGGGGGYTGTIVPPTIASLEGWYDASAIAGSLNDPIDTWNDDSGNGYNATAVNGSGFGALLKPGAINSLNTLQCTSNRSYTLSTSILNGASAASFACVFVHDSDPVSGEGALIDGFGTTGSASHHPYSDQTIYDGFGSNTRKTVGNPGFSLATPRVLVVRSATSDFTWHFDGTSFYSTSSNTVGIPGTGVGARYIGRHKGGQDIKAQIGEICIFSSALTSTEREEMEGYLAHKWGLTGNLPGGHPYKSSPP